MWNVRSRAEHRQQPARQRQAGLDHRGLRRPLEHLAEYTERLTRIFERRGTRGTWYAHASVGCLHVRPVLDMKSEDDVRKPGPSPRRPSPSSASTAAATPASTVTAWSGSEFHAEMFGPRLVRAFEEVKDAFDPRGLLSPGRSSGRRGWTTAGCSATAGYAPLPLETALDWSGGAAHRCGGDVQQQRRVPEIRAGRHVPLVPRHPGRAARRPGPGNALRLALTGQLGPTRWSPRRWRRRSTSAWAARAAGASAPPAWTWRG